MESPEKNERDGKMAETETGAEGSLLASSDAPQETQSKDDGAEEPSPKSDDTQVASNVSTAKTSKRWVKPLVICALCVLIAVIAVEAFFVWSAGEKRGVANAAVEHLKGSVAVSELVIPSQWGDQAGFSVGGVDVDSVSYDPFSPNDANVHITADIGNGTYNGQAEFDVDMSRESGPWSYDVARTGLFYYPIAGVSDEVVLERIPELIEEADRLCTAMDEGRGHVAASTLFGPGTTATVERNDFADLNDDVAVALSVQKDGMEYDTTLEVGFEWLESINPDGDWELSTVTLGDDAFMAAASFPHEGMSSDRTPEEAAEASATFVAADEWYSQFSRTLRFVEGSPYAWALMENVPNNTVDLVATVTLDDGTVIYESPRVAPNHTLEAIRINAPLALGSYAGNVHFTAYATGTNNVAGTDDVALTIVVG